MIIVQYYNTFKSLIILLFQLYAVTTSVLRNEATWEKSFCNGYIFLLTEGEELVKHASVNHFKAASYVSGDSPPFFWNYRGHYVISLQDPNVLSPEDIVHMYNFRKTENVAILESLRNRSKVVLWSNTFLAMTPELVFVDAWENARFRGGRNVFPDKFNDFQGSPIKVATFELPPSVVYKQNSESNAIERLGVDVEVVELLGRFKNFSVDYVQVSNKEKWGLMTPNGSWTGLMREAYDDLSHIAVCNNFIDYHRWKYIDYSYPYNFMPACFITPSPKPLPQWQSPILPYPWTIWMSIGVTFLLGGSLLYVILALTFQSEAMEFRSVAFNYLFMIGGLTMRSVSLMPTQMPGRLYAGFVWIFCLIISTGYSANLVAFLSVTQMTEPIDTLQQLADSDLRIATHGLWKRIFQLSNDKAIQAIWPKIETNINFHSIFYEVEAGNFAFFQNLAYLELNRDARFTYGGRSTVRIVPQCFLPFSVAMILQKNSPLTNSLTADIIKIYESGLVNHWKRMIIRYLTRKYAAERSDVVIETLRIKPLGLVHVQGIFYILALGYIFGAVIVLFEVALRPKKKE